MGQVGGLPSNSSTASDYGQELHDAVQDRWSNKITSDAFFHQMQDALQHLSLSPSDLNKALSNTDIDHLVSDIGTIHGRSDSDQLTGDQEAYLLGQFAKASPRVQMRVEKQANLLDQAVRTDLRTTRGMIVAGNFTITQPAWERLRVLGQSIVPDLETKRQKYLDLKNGSEPQSKIDQALAEYHIAAIKGLAYVRQSGAKESDALDDHIKNLDAGIELAYLARNGSVTLGATLIPVTGAGLVSGGFAVALLGVGKTWAQRFDGEIGTLGSAGKALATNTANAAVDALAGLGYKALAGRLGFATNFKVWPIFGAGGLNIVTGAAHRLIQGEGREALDPIQVWSDGATGATMFLFFGTIGAVMQEMKGMSNPDIRPDLQFNLAKAYAAKGNYGQALSELDTLIKIDPKNAEAYVHRALAFYRLGYLPGASSDLDKAIELDASYAAAKEQLRQVTGIVAGVEPENQTDEHIVLLLKQRRDVIAALETAGHRMWVDVLRTVIDHMNGK